MNLNYRSFRKMNLAIQDKDKYVAEFMENVSQIEDIFQKYDTILLLSSISIKCYSMLIHQTYSENEITPEVVIEYAINFGLSLPNNNGLKLADDVVDELYGLLVETIEYNSFWDIPQSNDETIKNALWKIHSNTINVRGEVYMSHLKCLCNELVSFVYKDNEILLKEYEKLVSFLTNVYNKIEDDISCFCNRNLLFFYKAFVERFDVSLKKEIGF